MVETDEVAGIVWAGTLMGGVALMDRERGRGSACPTSAKIHHEPDGIGRHDASKGARQRRIRLPARGRLERHQSQAEHLKRQVHKRRPGHRQYIRNAYVTDGNVAWVKWDGFDASKFGWISDQKAETPKASSPTTRKQRRIAADNDTDNTYAEIVGSEIGKSIYQKIDTQNSADAVYTVRFDHAALSPSMPTGMQALVNGKPATMTRIGGNKAGDKTGWTGTDIVTHATNTDHYRHDGQWATYEGKVTIPANTPVSTFMFKSLNEAKPDMGNLIDNLTFKIAYRLSYDSNGGTKAKASQISSMTEGKASETDGKR